MKAINPSVDKTKDGMLQVLLILAGVAAGKFTTAFASKFLPAWAAPLLNSAGLIPHFSGASANEKAFGNGMLIAGTLDSFAQLQAKIPFLQKFSPFVPKLNGVGNHGSFAPRLNGPVYNQTDVNMAIGSAPVTKGLISDSGVLI